MIYKKKEGGFYASKVRQFLNEYDGIDWSLFPNVNGTLLLEQDDAAISIASSQYSYYAEKDDNIISAEGKETTVDNLLDTIHTINAFMQR